MSNAFALLNKRFRAQRMVRWRRLHNHFDFLRPRSHTITSFGYNQRH